MSEKPVLKTVLQGAYTELQLTLALKDIGSCYFSAAEIMLHPIHYRSHASTPAEKKYSSYELEVLAMAVAPKKFLVYLMEQKFEIVPKIKLL